MSFQTINAGGVMASSLIILPSGMDSLAGYNKLIQDVNELCKAEVKVVPVGSGMIAMAVPLCLFDVVKEAIIRLFFDHRAEDRYGALLAHSGGLL